MSGYALQVLSDDPGSYRWVLYQVDIDTMTFKQVGVAECDFQTYADALNGGTLALAKADGEQYENEAADPVGDADCGAIGLTS